MAYDKVVDSAFLEAGLKKVGDSIRAKAGTSELLEFPDAMSAAVDAINTSKPEQTKTATPSLSQQTISPDSGKVLSGVTVEPITSILLTSLDPDFKAENIAEGVDMFGVVGTMTAGANYDTCTVELKHGRQVRYLWAEVPIVTNGVVSYEVHEQEANDITINNVLCGSLLMAYGDNLGTSGTGSVTGMEYIVSGYDSTLGGYKEFFHAPTSPGSTGTIVIESREPLPPLLPS